MTIRVLVTRPVLEIEDSERLILRIKKLGLEALSYPVTEFVALNSPDSKLFAAQTAAGDFDWHVFGSRAAVYFFADLMRKNDLKPKFKKVAAQGVATAQLVVERFGITPVLVPEIFTSEELAKELLSLIKTTDSVLIPASKLTRNIVFDALAQKARVSSIELYTLKQNSKLPEVGLVSDLVAVFFSPSGVEAFMKSAPESLVMVRPLAISLGPVTSNALRDAGFKNIVEAAVHSEDGVLQVLEELYVVT